MEADECADRDAVDFDAKIAYWDRIAADYDSLYQDPWSAREDALVLRRLTRIPLADGSRVLDLACGTGYGFALVGRLANDLECHGRDVSEVMLRKLREKYPDASTTCGSAEDLDDLPEDAFDLVTTFSGGGSYPSSPAALLRAAKRVVRPGGFLYVSVFGRYSLRRLVHGRFTSAEFYRTRGDRVSEVGDLVQLVSRRGVRALVAALGLEPVVLDSQGTLSGVCQHPALWTASRLLDKGLPLIGHTMELVLHRRQ